MGYISYNDINTVFIKMGHRSSILRKLENFGLKEYRIVMLGLDNAGKTSILYRLQLQEISKRDPTIGFNHEEILPFEGLKFSVWDIGGRAELRTMWKNYLCGTDGLIFVVDSSDRERMGEAREALDTIVANKSVIGVPVLIIANKCDMPEILTEREIIDLLDLPNLTGRPWCIRQTTVLNGEGLMESMKQLAAMIKVFRSKKS